MNSQIIPDNTSLADEIKIMDHVASREARKILIVEDNDIAAQILEKSLQDSGYLTEVAVHGKDFFEKISDDFSMVILDLNLPDIDGYTCLQFVQHYFRNIPVLVLSCFGAKDAVLSMQCGAVHYIQKPVHSYELIKVVRRNLSQEEGNCSGEKFTTPEDLLVGKSKASIELINQIAKSKIGNYLLLTGGSGKTSLAKILATKPYTENVRYIVCDCQNLKKELLIPVLKCSTKTCFIFRNIEYLNDTQVSCLIRILSSSEHRITLTSKESLNDLKHLPCKDLLKMHAFQNFTVPGIGEIQEDLPFILNRIISGHEFEDLDISEQSIEELLNADWEDISEMKDCLRRNKAFPYTEHGQIVVLTKKELNSQGRYSNIIGMSLSEIEKIAILETIQSCNGNKSKAARILQITEKTIYNKLSKYE